MLFGLEFGKPRRIARNVECSNRRHTGGLMLAVPVPRRTGEHRHDHVRPERTNHPHDILQNRIRKPETGCLLERSGIAKVVRPSEELTGSIQLASGQELSRPDQAEGSSQLRADEVLTPFSTRQGQIRSLHPIPAAQQRKQGRVFVIGMRPDDE